MRATRALLALLLAVPAGAQLRAVPRLPTSLSPATAVRAGAPTLAVSPGLSLAAPARAPSLLPSLPAAAAAPALVAAPAAAPAAESSLRALDAALAAPEAAPAPLLGTFFDASVARAAADSPVAASVPGAAAPPATRALSAVKKLRVGTYNVLNLFQKVGKYERQADGTMRQTSGRVDKEEASRHAQAKAILEEDLDVVVLQEVENITALEDFNREHLGGAYRAFLIEGNDERGIDVAFLIKKDLPFDVEQRSRKGETWKDPALGGREVPLFSRDLTSLVIRAPGREEPLAVLFGTHMKSKRDRPGDPESGLQRAAQAKRTAEILAETKAEFGPGVPVLIAGDFNGDLASAPELRAIFEAGFVDGFDAAPSKTSREDRVTHTYHPQGGAAQAHQMDGVVIDKAWARLVKSARAHRYKDASGKDKPVPRTYDERSRNPSDHFPVVVELDFAAIIEAQDEAARLGNEMGAAQAVQLALLRPLAAKLELDVTVTSMLGATLGLSPSLKDLLDDAAALRALRASPAEAEAAVAASVVRARLRRDADGKPDRDDLENLFLQHREAASTVEIARNGFFLEREREAKAAALAWSLDLREASWGLYDDRVVLFLGTARLGDVTRPFAFSIAPSLLGKGAVSARVRAIAAWPGLTPPSREAVLRLAADLTTAGY